MNREIRKLPIAPHPQTAPRPTLEPPPAREPPVMNNTTGRVIHDERGNAIWEWAKSAEESSIESEIQQLEARQLETLANQTLSLADEAPPVTVKASSPYDGLPEPTRRSGKKDLRRLSEWLKLKKQAAGRTPHDQ